MNNFNCGEFLKGKTKEAQKRLEELFKSIGPNPKILWYPSAGNDYRDLLELTDVRNNLKDSDILTPTTKDNLKRGEMEKRINIAIDYKLTHLPDLFIHTDYNKKLVTLKKGVIFDDSKTQVQINELYPLKINDKFDIKYEINPEFVDFPQDAPKSPEIYLLDITLKSNILGEIKRPVIYFLFENINFLQEILLKNKINISYIVKVREGCELGGNRKSITVAYTFLSILKTEYLIIDNEVYFDYKLAWKIAEKYGLIDKDFDYEWAWERVADVPLKLSDFELKELTPVRPVTSSFKWSGNSVSVWEVNFFNNRRLTLRRMKEIVNPLEEKWGWRVERLFGGIFIWKVD